MKTLAHLSDLHLGRSERVRTACERIVARALADDIDHVVVSGDLTHRGALVEWDLFRYLFEPLSSRGRLTIVPGNHDRLNDDAARHMRGACRVWVERAPGLHLVCFDSTGPHNVSLFRGHGQLTPADLLALDAALGDAPDGSLVVVLLHHHPLPLPEESFHERFSTWVGWPFATELATGRALIDLCHGRADLILHGHRHVPVEHVLDHPLRPLRICNAGASTELGAFRVHHHAGGTLLTSHAVSASIPACRPPLLPTESSMPTRRAKSHALSPRWPLPTVLSRLAK